MRVLIVEDDPDTANLLAALVAQCGHEPQVAREGDAALETAARWSPDFVLLDLLLPGMDGYTLAEKMRDEVGLSAARIVAISGYPANQALNEAHGLDGHLMKPVSLDRLRELLAG